MPFAQLPISSQFRKSPSGAFTALTTIRSPKLSLRRQRAEEHLVPARRDRRPDSASCFGCSSSSATCSPSGPLLKIHTGRRASFVGVSVDELNRVLPPRAGVDGATDHDSLQRAELQDVRDGPSIPAGLVQAARDVLGDALGGSVFAGIRHQDHGEPRPTGRSARIMMAAATRNTTMNTMPTGSIRLTSSTPAFAWNHPAAARFS